MDAVYGVAHVLLRRHDEREGKEARGRHGVVEAEHPRVDVHVGHPQEAAQLAEDLQHLGGCGGGGCTGLDEGKLLVSPLHLTRFCPLLPSLLYLSCLVKQCDGGRRGLCLSTSAQSQSTLTRPLARLSTLVHQFIN